MTVSQSLLQWIEGPRRSYGEGLALFRLISDRREKSRYLAFLEEVRDASPGDIHFNMLQRCLSGYRREVLSNPAYRTAVMSSVFPVECPAASVPVPVPPVLSAPAAQTAPHGPLSGLRFSRPAGLPPELAPVYDRIREITPEYARLHADLTSAPDDASRLALARELCALDDERRRLWDRLDAWARESGVSSPVPRPVYSSVQILSGLEMAARRKRLQDNIRTARLSVAKFEKNRLPVPLERARKRLERYIAELDELERRIADAQG